jgi:hypothetical protein
MIHTMNKSMDRRNAVPADGDEVVEGVAAELVSRGIRMTVRAVAGRSGKPLGHATAAAMLRRWSRRTLLRLAGADGSAEVAEESGPRRIALAVEGGRAFLFAGAALIVAPAAALHAALAASAVRTVPDERGGGLGVTLAPDAVMLRLAAADHAFLSRILAAKGAVEGGR